MSALEIHEREREIYIYIYVYMYFFLSPPGRPAGPAGELSPGVSEESFSSEAHGIRLELPQGPESKRIVSVCDHDLCNYPGPYSRAKEVELDKLAINLCVWALIFGIQTDPSWA